MKTPAIALLSAVLLGACATTANNCPLGEDGQTCVSMGDTYRAAKAGAGSQTNVLAAPADTHQYGRALNFMAGPQNMAGPVYNPAKPHRVWIAPWTDANGILHSGEHIYFTTPGGWNYGPMTAPGSAAGLMAPIRPDQLGFQPSNSPDGDDDLRSRRRSGVVLPN